VSSVVVYTIADAKKRLVYVGSAEEEAFGHKLVEHSLAGDFADGKSFTIVGVYGDAVEADTVVASYNKFQCQACGGTGWTWAR